MVTLITEQLRKQSLDEAQTISFTVNPTFPAVGSSPTVTWSACKPAQGKFILIAVVVSQYDLICICDFQTQIYAAHPSLKLHLNRTLTQPT